MNREDWEDLFRSLILALEDHTHQICAALDEVNSNLNAIDDRLLNIDKD